MHILFKRMALFIFFFTVYLYAGRNDTTFIINPTVLNVDSLSTLNCNKKFRATVVNDTSLSRSQRGIVGETRIGRNKTAPILCSPVPSLVLKQSLKALLINKQIAADTLTDSVFAIEIDIFDFSITEISRKITQTMTADIILAVKVHMIEDDNTLKHFTVKTQYSFSTFDTSKYAEKVLQEALSDALREIYQNIVQK